jgi:HD-GYP domain-containing protein (c-di-GMP phosphodiesterase class II)
MALLRTSDETSKLDTSDTLVLRPEHLRLGMYVDLNCSWFKHPFPRRSFKLTSQNQITTIKGLGLATVLVYPRESDPETDEEGNAIQPTPSSSGVSETTAQTSGTEAGAEPEAPTPVEEEQPTHGDYHQAVELASTAYRQMLDQSSQMMKNLVSGSEEGLRHAQSMIGGLSTLLTNTEAAGTVASAFDSEDIANANLLHALNVATLSMIVAQQFDIDQDALQLIGMAGLLLDVGEQRIPRHILQNRARRSEVENVKYQLHPYLGVEMLRRFPGFPEEVLDVIRSHHERLDGSGYPEKLKGDQISLPTRIVSAVDHYDALVNSFHPEDALSPAEALATMYKHQQRLFSPEVLIAMIQTLGVFPPGTVVTLTDGSFGQVLNINFKHRLKPLVLLCDQAAPADQPHTVDLQTESELSILRAIPRGELPANVVEYFRIKRWTGYFVQSSMRAA